MRILIATIILGLAVRPGPAVAETIYFKDGTVLNGEITEESKYYIRVFVDGDSRTFFRQNIDRVTEEGPPDQAGLPVTEKKKELVRRLLQANGSLEGITRIINQIAEDAPEQAGARVKQALKTGDLVDIIIPIYAKHYNEQELKELIVFYTSPVGRKHLELTPRLVEETMVAAQEYIQNSLMQLGDQP